MSVKDKKILLAVSGSIAAYKTPQLVRLLVKGGAEVKVVMTESAKDFVSPLTLATVSKHEVLSSVKEGEQWNNHVHLGRWADVMIVAPASANTIAKMANGICDNLLLAVYLSATCPVMIAPAMDEDMWFHPSTKRNVAQLKQFGHHFIETEHGELASGIIGYGRMSEPETILEATKLFLAEKCTIRNGKIKTALITAGPTYEPLDPVRFIGNYSTGKMGIALAKCLADMGIQVHLVLGPTSQTVEHAKIQIYPVHTALEMYDQCQVIFPKVELAIMAAAVADYRPSERQSQKIKKENEDLHISLMKNPDILASLGNRKSSNQLLVGFALETENELENAKGKLIRKKADLIVLNSLNDEQSGFGYDTNKVTLIFADGSVHALPLQNKNDVAASIVNEILKL